MAERIIPNPKLCSAQTPGSGHESDLGELAALFAAHGGGSFPEEVAVDLALDIVLGEIVEHAVHSTGATGAAILFEREGELVCRASRGAIAPEMGARLSSRTGLTGECVRTREVLRCDDALIDSRADTEASRSLGVRSVVIAPLMRERGLVGVLAIFGPRADAFDEQDEIMLEALAVRVLKNLDRAPEVAHGLQATAEVIPRDAIGEDGKTTPTVANQAEEPMIPESLAPAVEPESSWESAADIIQAEKPSSVGIVFPEKGDEVVPEVLEKSPPSGTNIVTIALVTAIGLCVVLLATLIGLRISGSKSSAGHAGMAPQASATAPAQDAAPGNPTAASAADAEKHESTKAAVKTPTGSSTHPHNTVAQEGSLSVFENGKEVFRMPPAVHPASSEDAIKVEASREPLRRVEPEYPEAARQKGIQGAVVLDAHIGRNGAIQDVKLVSGPPLLADAAIAAVKQWRFQAQAVDAQTRVTLNFKIKK